MDLLASEISTKSDCHFVVAFALYAVNLPPGCSLIHFCQKKRAEEEEEEEEKKRGALSSGYLQITLTPPAPFLVLLSWRQKTQNKRNKSLEPICVVRRPKERERFDDDNSNNHTHTPKKREKEKILVVLAYQILDDHRLH